MTDLLLRIGVSNLCLSAMLAIAAWAVQTSGERPAVAHVLWVMALLKLVTPPLFSLPVIAVPGSTAAGLPGVSAALPPVAIAAVPDGTTAVSTPGTADQVKSVLLLVWLSGSACILVWSLIRIRRFHRLLSISAEEAPVRLQRLATGIAFRLGLGRVPMLYTTSAQLSPMVWWIGGRVRIYLPAALSEEMDAGQLRWIIAHELAHVRRRDHLVRWLEWTACVGFWWNPVAWWARRNLRINEEICCDALVVRSLRPDPLAYANSLLSAVEFLATPVLRPPAVASEINSGGFLERRFQMILSTRSLRTTPRWVSGLVLACAAILLPLGVAHAQDPDLDAVGRRLRESVQAGELTGPQARVMLDALRKMGAQDPERAERRFTEEDIERAAKRIKKGVAEGRISKEDARTRLEEMRRLMVEQADKDARRGKRDERARVEARLRKAVQAGELTREQAVERLEAMQRESGASRDVDLAALRRRLGEAVKAGKLTREQAAAKFEAARRKVEAKSDVDFDALRKRLGEAVTAGKLTREEAQEKLDAIRSEAGTKSDVDLEALRRRLGEAVRAGKLTREEAQAKLDAARKKVGARAETDRMPAYRDIEARILKAVRSGRLSPEEAAEHLDAARERITGDEKSERGR